MQLMVHVACKLTSEATRSGVDIFCLKWWSVDILLVTKIWIVVFKHVSVALTSLRCGKSLMSSLYWNPKASRKIVIFHLLLYVMRHFLYAINNPVRYPELYWGADKSLARPTSRCILFDGENISFDASLVIYTRINSTNIPPIMIINRMYEHQNLLTL